MEWMIGLAAACLLIRVGHALYVVGLSRAKNAAGTMLRVAADFCWAGLAFWAIGAAIWRGDRHWVAFASTTDPRLFALLAITLIGTPIPAAAMSERSRFWPLATLSVLLGGIIIPWGGAIATHGWLARMGFQDDAGAGWLHLSAAAAALAGIWAVKARSGKYHRDGSATMIPGHSLPMSGIGALAMLVGWIPYLAVCTLMTNKGSVALSSMNAVLAAASAGLAAMLFGRYRYGKPDVVLTVMGLLGGLVAVSAGAGQIGCRSSILIGAVAGVLVPVAVVWIDLLAHIDDPAGVIAIHGMGGAWGALAVGLLLHGTISQRLHQAGIQLLGVGFFTVLGFGLTAVVCVVLSKLTRLRPSEDDEFDGLDLAEHDIGAYPDFQQTTIKSYHLREA